jgi:hypothetical protein
MKRALSHLYAALPFDFWVLCRYAQRSELPRRCTCYQLPHAEDCRLFRGITKRGTRVYYRPAAR